jgi:hypothetical protein
MVGAGVAAAAFGGLAGVLIARGGTGVFAPECDVLEQAASVNARATKVRSGSGRVMWAVCRDGIGGT